jgi:aminopeptidase N
MKDRWLSILLFVIFGLTACGPRPSPPTPGGAEAALPQPSPAASTADSATASAASAAALSPGVACSPASQAAALQPDVPLDWDMLPVSACYQLELELLPAEAAYRGRLRVTIQNHTQQPWPDLVFRLYPNSPGIYGGQLEVASASIDGSAVEPTVFLQDLTGLRLELEKPLNPARIVQVELEFAGQTPRDLADTTWAYGVFNTTTSPPAMVLANWYPLLAVWEDGEWLASPVTPIGDAVVSETALYAVAITAPEGWQVVSTGTVVSAHTQNQVTRWEVVSGPVREFMVTASPEYTLSEMEVGGIQLRHWGLPGGNSRWSEALQATADSAELFASRFGDYPYNELDVVAAALELALGVEYPGLFLIQQDLYQLDEDQPYLLGLVVAHEAAHQWWYGLVGNDVLANPWMDEALATYSSLLYQEQFQPRVYPGTLDFYTQSVADAEKQFPGLDTGLSVEDFRADPGGYSRFVYQKGGLFFASLREKIGDQAFFAGLQQYFADQTFKTALPEDLFQSFESACRCDLDPFFEEWGLTGR